MQKGIKRKQNIFHESFKQSAKNNVLLFQLIWILNFRLYIFFIKQLMILTSIWVLSYWLLTECVKFFCCTSIDFCEQTHVSNKYNRTDVKKNDLSIMHRFSHTLLIAVIIVLTINNTCFRYIENKNRFKFLLVVLSNNLNRIYDKQFFSVQLSITSYTLNIYYNKKKGIDKGILVRF